MEGLMEKTDKRKDCCGENEWMHFKRRQDESAIIIQRVCVYACKLSPQHFSFVVMNPIPSVSLTLTQRGSERYGNGDQGQWDVALEALMARSLLTSP